MKERSRTEYDMLNILTGIGGYAFNTVLGFVCRMVFVRCLAQEYLGISGLFTNILSMLSLAELGIGSAIVYALYKPLAENDEDKVASLVDFYRKAYMVIGIFIGIVGLFLMPFIKSIVGTYTFKEKIYVIYLMYLFSSVISYFFSYRSSLLQAAQKQYIVSGINYLITILQSFFQIVFLIITKEYIYYLIIQIIGVIINNIVVSHVAVKQYPYIKQKNIKKISKNEIKSISKNVWYLLTNKLSSLLLSSTDNIITSYFQGIITVGMASNYILLTTTLNSLLNQLFNGLTGSVGNYNVLNDSNETKKLFYYFNFANFWIFGYACMGILFVSNDIITLCFGKEYLLPMSIPIILTINFFIIGMMNSVWIFKSALGQFKYGRYIVLLTGILNIVFSIILGKYMGLFGIYLATVISRLLTNAWYEPYALFKYSLKCNPLEYFVRYFKYIIIFIITAIINYIVYIQIDISVITNLILHIISCTIITNGIFYILFKNKEEFIFFKEKALQIVYILKNKFKFL